MVSCSYSNSNWALGCSEAEAGRWRRRPERAKKKSKVDRVGAETASVWRMLLRGVEQRPTRSWSLGPEEGIRGIE